MNSSSSRGRVPLMVVLAITTAALILSHGVLAEAWWPRTGEAFAAGTEPGHTDPCDLIKEPARAYCVGNRATLATDQPGSSTAVWMLASPAVAVFTLVLWRRRHGLTRRRR